MIQKTITFCVVLCLLTFGAIAQEEQTESEKRNTLSLGIGHTFTNKGLKNGNEAWLALPSWALDYQFRVANKWSLNLQNEIITTDFEIEKFDKETIKRTTPFSSVFVVGFHPIKNLAFVLGGGGEFTREENFAVIRFGVEPSWEVTERIEILLSGIYDFKVDGYNSWGISFGAGYKF